MPETPMLLSPLAAALPVLKMLVLQVLVDYLEQQVEHMVVTL